MITDAMREAGAAVLRNGSGWMIADEHYAVWAERIFTAMIGAVDEEVVSQAYLDGYDAADGHDGRPMFKHRMGIRAAIAAIGGGNG